MSICAAPVMVDVRKMALSQRHAMVFSAFQRLSAGEALELISDHDPESLRIEFESEKPGRFSWACLAQGPAVWRISITRIKAGHGDGGCCGGCGGA